jgi:hypothetical protein
MLQVFSEIPATLSLDDELNSDNEAKRFLVEMTWIIWPIVFRAEEDVASKYLDEFVIILRRMRFEHPKIFQESEFWDDTDEFTDPVVLKGWLAWMATLRGNYQFVRDQLAIVVDKLRQEGSLESEKAFFIRKLLARAVGEMGDAAAARDQLAELVVIARRENDYLDLDLEIDYAESVGRAGNPQAARDMLRKLCDKFVDRNARSVVFLQAHVARWTGRAGNPDLAYDMLAEIIPKLEPEELDREDLQLLESFKQDFADFRQQINNN